MSDFHENPSGASAGPGVLPAAESGPAPDAADRLGSEPVGRLLLRFSLPAIAGMLVNALYNVVDRIFVGRGVNEAALGGLSLAMPLMTVSMAFAMLFGVGSANMISMRLGQGRREDAARALNHCLVLLAASGAAIALLGSVFLDRLLPLLGAQEGSGSLEYARRYCRIIMGGAVFAQVGFGLSHSARAQGFPAVTMMSMLLGAGMNVVLDPLFIFVFRWGVEGAAWATVISQAASCAWIFLFSAGRKPVVRLSLAAFRPSFRIAREIMAFGSSQCIMHFVMAGVQLLYNTSIGWYGADSLGVANGGDIALSGMNIVNSVSMLILMPVFGINQGAQPILGYNYGAKKFGRALRAYFAAVAAASSVCLLGFIAAQCFPLAITRLFAPDGSPALLSFAPWAMRVVSLLLPLAGFQIVSSNMFAVTGRPKLSIALSMLRQFIVLIPCLVVFGKVWGLWGLVAAAPVADGFSFVFTGILIFFELRRLRRQRIRVGASA